MLSHSVKTLSHHVKTEEDIIKAFKEESRAKWTYKAFAEKAEQAGNPEVAKLFRAAATSEDIQSHLLLNALQEMSRATCDLWAAGMYDPKTIKDSVKENLQKAIAGNRELSELYPQMIQDAKQDGWSFAKECFTHSSAVDQVYDQLFSKALQNIGQQQNVDYFVCEGCGNTVDRKPADNCKICGSSQSAFQAVG